MLGKPPAVTTSSVGPRDGRSASAVGSLNPGAREPAPSGAGEPQGPEATTVPSAWGWAGAPPPSAAAQQDFSFALEALLSKDKSGGFSLTSDTTGTGVKGLALMEMLRQRVDDNPGILHAMAQRRMRVLQKNRDWEQYFKQHTPVRHFTTVSYFLTLIAWILNELDTPEPRIARVADLATAAAIFGEQISRENGKVQFPWQLTLMNPEPELICSKEAMPAKPTGSEKLANISRTVDASVFAAVIASTKELLQLNKFRTETDK